MAILPWNIQRNLENSLYEHLKNIVDSESIKVLDKTGTQIPPSIVIGDQVSSDWKLPVVQIYCDSIIQPRLSIGSNKRQTSYTIIIDVRTLNRGQLVDLTDWVVTEINEGFDYYEYSPNPSSPENINKSIAGYASVDFIANVTLRLGENVEAFDKFRQNITISIDLSFD